MDSGMKVVLEGGPEDLTERIVSVGTAGEDLKIPHGNGYEHFRATPRHADTEQGPLPVYEWWERTEMPA